MRRNILAIVGSVKLTMEQEVHARAIIRSAIEKYQPDAVVSGGADGIDTVAEKVAHREFALPVIVCTPASRAWLHYKARNQLIANICTRLVRIHSVHSTTYGSGWTRDRAAELGKPTEEHRV